MIAARQSLAFDVRHLSSRYAAIVMRVVAAFAFVPLFNLGCGRGGSSVEEASQAIALEWAAAQDSASLPPVSTAASNHLPLLYVDASRSMAGFAGCTQSPTEFNKTLDRISSALGLTSVIRVGEKQPGSGVVFENVSLTGAVHCPGFYDRLQNPDYAVVQAAQQDSITATVLYVTDGVQSDWQGRNAGPTLGLLKQWLQQRRALAILSFKSRFSGLAWSEQRRQMIGRVTQNARPFYVFVLARSEADLDQLLGQLSSRTLDGSVTSRFSQSAVQCSADVGEKLSKWARTVEPPWAMVKHPDVGTGEAVIEYDCHIRRDYPLEQIHPRVSLQYRQWLNSQFNPPRPPLPQTALRLDSIAVTEGRSRAFLGGTMPADSGARYGLYLLRLNPEPGDLRPSIADLSTESDATPDSFDRTYRMSWLIEQLARAHLAALQPTPYALTVQYR